MSLRSRSQRTKLGASRDGSTTAHETDVSKRSDLSRRGHRAEHPLFNYPFVLLKILNLFKNEGRGGWEGESLGAFEEETGCVARSGKISETGTC